MHIPPNTHAIYLIRAHGANLHDDDDYNPWSYENVRHANEQNIYDIYKVGTSRDLSKRLKQYEAYGYLSHQVAFLRIGHIERNPSWAANHLETQLKDYVKMYSCAPYTRREWFMVKLCDKYDGAARYRALSEFWTRMKALEGDTYDGNFKNFWKYHWEENKDLTKGWKKRHKEYKEQLIA